MENTSLNSSNYIHERSSSFNAIPQDQAADREDRFVDALCHEQMRATSFESFANSFFATHAEIARPPCLGNNLVEGFSAHKIHDSEAPNALEIYPSSAQGTDPVLEKNPYDGYSVFDFCPTQKFETLSMLERSREIDPLLHPTPAEVMAPSFEKIPCDDYSTYNSCLKQNSGIPRTLEVYLSSGYQEIVPLLQLTNAPYIQDFSKFSTECKARDWRVSTQIRRTICSNVMQRFPKMPIMRIPL